MPAELDLDRLYDEHAQALFAFLLNLTRNEEDTREVLQEIFVKLARQPELLSGARDERSFLIRLAHNAAIDVLRRRSTRVRYHEAFGEEETSTIVKSGDPDEAAFGAALSAALRELPPEQRTVVHLKLWEDMTLGRIAETLQVSANTVASRYRYGLDKLRELLRPFYEEIR